MTNALLIGDYTNASYHPLTDIDSKLSSILSEQVSLTYTEDRGNLLSEKLHGFDLCICYGDRWDDKLTQAQLAGILTYLAQGGSLLVIHNGISYQGNPEFAQLVGAKFIGHPPYQQLEFNMTGDHPITKGISNFVMEEELYRYERDPFAPLEVLMECSNGEITEPAVWVRPFGLGNMVHLAPGHDIQSLNNSTYQKIIQQAVAWLLEQ